MCHRILRYFALVLFSTALALPFAASAQTQAFPSRENGEGGVMVTVTPLMLSKTADVWRFEVRLTTHVAPLTQDMAAVAMLSDGDGRHEQPSAWTGDGPGGHHRKGILVFKAIIPAPGAVTLHIRQVGGVPDRSFTWSLASP